MCALSALCAVRVGVRWVCLKKCAKRAKSAKSPLLMCRLADPWALCSAISTGRTLACSGRTSRLSSASVSSRLGPVTSGGVFSRLSKLLNLEDALSAPCLRSDFRSPHSPAERRDVRKGLICRFRCHINVGGRCRGRACRCKAKQGRRGKTALTCEYLLPH